MEAYPYQSAVGELMYAAICIHPDIAFVVQTLGQFSSNPGIPHWQAIKQVMYYLKGTHNYGLILGGADINTLHLIGWCDANWAHDPNDRKSTSGYSFFLGSGAVCYRLKKQTSIALSTAEAEYMAAVTATCEAFGSIHFCKNLVSTRLGSPLLTPTIR